MTTLRSLALCSALLLGAAPIAAQKLAGHYEMVGKPEITMLIVPSLINNLHIALVFLDGEVLPEETAIYTEPVHGVFPWRNAPGNEGNTTIRPDGSLHDEVRTGPNAGHTTDWQPVQGH